MEFTEINKKVDGLSGQADDVSGIKKINRRIQKKSGSFTASTVANDDLDGDVRFLAVNKVAPQLLPLVTRA